MSLLLIAAAAVAGIGLQEGVDAAMILVIVLLNGVIGVVQEGRAARAVAALRELESPAARVRRDGREEIVPARDVVPGDVVLLAAGDRVPADLRLLRAPNLEVDESLLTGESLPVTKSEGETDGRDHRAPTDRSAMVFSGTLVTRGSATGIVRLTGRETALGRIAERLRERPPPTPLQTELRALSARLGGISIAIAAAVFVVILGRVGIDRRGLEESFLSAVALAVAAVPEGLATVVAVALALGVRRMASERAIVRRLPAVETLGSTDVIATDKTGTLTENRMRLDGVVVSGSGRLRPGELPPAVAHRAALVAALCSDATSQPPSGDPVEIALLELAGSAEGELRRANPRLAEAPFDPAHRRMMTVHRIDGLPTLLVKGAPETVLDHCRRTWGKEGDVRALDDAGRTAILAAADRMARAGIRVLALAIGEPVGGDADTPIITGDLLADREDDLTLVCLAGLRDPVRPEARAAVSEARSAGIRIVMVTGDHPETASAIAQETGLALRGGPVLVGADVPTGIPEDPASAPVYARVDPDQKLSLVDALRSRGHVVAVTGDGVNDAPALRRADIGVAMGRSGSDVAREAADMVITDDNLTTIVTAIREGRGVYDSIRKVVDYLVAGNLSEIAVVVAALVLFPALGVPLLPLQLLWINLLTDGLPALALGVDPVDPALMTRPPRARGERLLGARRLGLLASRGILIAGATLASLAVSRFVWNEPWLHARALMFTVLVVAHLIYAFAARLPSRGLWTNAWLLGAVAGGIVLQLLIIAWPPARDVFDTAPLSLHEWALVAAAGLLPTTIMLAAESRRSGVG